MSDAAEPTTPSGSSGPRGRRAKVGLVSLGVGLAAAGVGAALGVAAERLAVGRPLLPPFGLPPGDGEDYGGLHTPGRAVLADDAVRLHVEVEDIGTPGRNDPTVVFSHGYALTMDSWHFQRQQLRREPGRSLRLVFWDQRGHGRSASGRPGSSTIDQLGSDLSEVIDAVAPSGPLILIGHSMGGMTVMSLAHRRPELFAERVRAVGLVSTSAGGLDDVDFGITGLGRLVQRFAPSTVKALTRTPRLVERGRRIVSDLETVLVRRYSYASPVSNALVRFTADMIASTRLEVISDFLPTFSTHDKRAALSALAAVPTLVIVGDHDLLTPADHSVEIAELLPAAQHVVVPDGGHLLMLEHPEVVNAHLLHLIGAAVDPDGARRVRLPSPVRRTVASLRRRRPGRGPSA